MTARYLALTILDLAWIGMAMLSGLGVGWALLGHALLTGLTYHAWLRSDPHGGFAAAILGVAGPIGLMLGQILGRWNERGWGRPSGIARDEGFAGRAMAHPRRGAAREMARLLDGRVYYPAPDRLDSLVAILRHAPVAERRRALETVVRSFEPGLSPLVAQVLNDPDQTIRALAAAASARIVHNLGEHRAGLEARIARGDAEAVQSLGRLLADHGQSNILLSDMQRAAVRDEAALLLARGGRAGEAERLAIEVAWAARDYDAIDRIRAAAGDADDRDAAWWRAEAVR